jgi:hypothetical protein
MKRTAHKSKQTRKVNKSKHFKQSRTRKLDKNRRRTQKGGVISQLVSGTFEDIKSNLSETKPTYFETTNPKLFYELIKLNKDDKNKLIQKVINPDNEEGISKLLKKKDIKDINSINNSKPKIVIVIM